MRIRVPRALDLFCCAGGASAGIAMAGFDVTGVDLVPRPSYPFRFVLADALSFPLDGFDFVWASPPCQAYTAYARRPGHVREAPRLIERTRDRLAAAGVDFAIENVRGAPLLGPALLCGSMFGLPIRRHRFLETSFPLPPLACVHPRGPGVYPCATNRTNPRRTVEVGVWRIPLAVQREAMGIGWMSREELSQAVPPAYAFHVASHAPSRRAA